MTLRILQSSVDLLVNTTNSTTDGTPTSDFNPKVFWSINAFIAFLLVATVLGCWYRVYHCGVRFDSNTYRLRVLRAQEAAAEAQKESPEKRKRLLLASFRRHGVTKVSLRQWWRSNLRCWMILTQVICTTGACRRRLDCSGRDGCRGRRG